MTDFRFKRNWGPTPNYEKVLSYKRPNNNFILVSGPCSVESPQQINMIAEHVAKHGATHLRGGVFRAGTYPGKNFGWVETDLIKSYQEAAHAHGLKNIIEVLDYSGSSIDSVMRLADCLQVGARSMQNYSLLRKVGALGMPVFLKRGVGATIDEFLGAAEHILDAGCTDLTLIERGSATLNNHVRWDLSISMIPAVKLITEIPIIVDASHGTGRRDLVRKMTWAGIAAGADGCLIETHYNPHYSMSDADQAIDFQEYEKTVSKIHDLRSILSER